MDALLTQRLEGSPTISRLAPCATRLVTTPNHRGPGRQQRGRQPVVGTRPRGRPGGAPAPTATRCSPPVDRRTVDPLAHTPAPWGRSLWLSRAGLDLWQDRRGDSPGVWYLLPSCPCRPLAQNAALEPAKTRTAGSATRRRGHHPLAGGDLAGAQKGAQAQGHTLLFID
jgi:hypothetical protein